MGVKKDEKIAQLTEQNKKLKKQVKKLEERLSSHKEFAVLTEFRKAKK